jgi:hypothetical protein
VIEFSDGRLELPVTPVKNEPAKPGSPNPDGAKPKPGEAPAAHAPAPAPAPEGPSQAPDSVTEPEIPPAAAEQTLPAIVPESGYQSAEPVPEISPSEEQEPAHVVYVRAAGGAGEEESAAISEELPAAES